jgi:MFS family permease
MTLQDREPAYRWVIVAAVAVILAVAMGQLVNGLTAFFIPLEQTMGWARGDIALINSAGLVGLAIGGIVMGMLADRVHIRSVALCGALATGACVLLAAQADALWQLYALFFLAGLLGGGALFAPLIALTGRWFAAGAGLAIGIVSAGQAVGQGGVPFAAAFLIEAFGWRGAMTTFGIVSLALLVPLALLLRDPPRPAGGPAATAAPEPLPGHVVVPWLCFAAILCCTGMSVPLMHLLPLIQERGIAAPDAGGVVFVMLVAAIAGRVFFGRLADRIGGMPAYMTAVAWQAALMFPFTQIDGLTSFYVLAAVYGFGYAGVMTGLLITIGLLAPASWRATATGTVIAFAFLGHGIGGYQAGLLHDLTGAYQGGFGVAALASAFNLVVVGSLLVTLRRRGGVAGATAAAG